MGVAFAGNRSRQNKSYADWTGHSRLGPPPPEVQQRLMNLETDLQVTLQDQINALLAQQ